MSAHIEAKRNGTVNGGNHTRETVGVIGVGLMGIALSERLLAGGFGVLGWDINPDRGVLLAEFGGVAASNAREVVAGSQRIFLSLPDIDIVESVLLEVTPALRPGQVIIDTTTSDPERTEAVGV